MQNEYRIRFLPEDKSITAAEGMTVLDAAAGAGVIIDGSCAGKGVCGTCRVTLQGGSASPVTEKEEKKLTAAELEKGVRLACQMYPESDLTILVPENRAFSRKKNMNRLPEDFIVHPDLQAIYLEVPKATLEYQRNDLDRIREASHQPELIFPPKLLYHLQKAMAKKRGKITLVTCTVREGVSEAVAVFPGKREGDLYGAAFDVGTTTIVGLLWNLTTGKLADAEAATNPQSVYGADVISRIQFCRETEENLAVMQSKVLTCISGMLTAFQERNSLSSEDILRVTMVGNTTMSHLFLGIDPLPLAKVPFAPVFCQSITQPAENLGLPVYPFAPVTVLPNMAGHVGSDITAVMLACDIFALKGNSVVLDIGTNGEILAASDGVVKTCSTAAGPAFEGACISCGMRAEKGAIEKVWIEEDVRLQVIGDTEPVGLCGSGLIDATAQLLKAGLVTMQGKLLTAEQARQKGIPEALCSRISGEGNDTSFLLSHGEKGDVIFRQQDLREVQLAKGAILGGVRTLLKKLEITEEQVDRVLIAGAFGSYIDKESALLMGLLPSVPAEKILSIGNGAGTGASMALLSEKKLQQAEVQARLVEHVELSRDTDFQSFYINGMLFR